MKPRTAKPVRISTAPLALASDGTLLVNAIRLTTDDDLDAVIEAARAHGGTIFVGVALGKDEVKEALRQLDDMAAEVAARISGGRRR